ncbi:hypothetical protein, partial [uncultured Gammaproteobacteria bacterium]
NMLMIRLKCWKVLAHWRMKFRAPLN